MTVHYAADGPGRHEGHSHPDLERLTFGCSGCVLRVERERWATAPERIVHCHAHLPPYIATHPDGNHVDWTYTVRARIPDGATLEQINDRGLLDDGGAMWDDMPASWSTTIRQTALECAEVEAVRVENIPAEKAPQPSLFGGDAA